MSYTNTREVYLTYAHCKHCSQENVKEQQSNPKSGRFGYPYGRPGDSFCIWETPGLSRRVGRFAFMKDLKALFKIEPALFVYNSTFITNSTLPIHPISKAISENKHRETGMYTSFFKREPRTNSTLPIHQTSKAISENKHRGLTQGNVQVQLVF